MATSVYEFLYWINEIDEKHMRVKSIRARNIKWACRKFINRKPETLIKIDYEVRTGVDEFIDISDEEGVKEFI